MLQKLRCEISITYTSLVAQLVKNPGDRLQRRKPGFDPWVRKVWRREWLPTPEFLPGKSQGLRNLVGYIVHGVTKSWT